MTIHHVVPVAENDGVLDSTGDYWHYQFYVRSAGVLVAFGLPVIRRGQMTLDELEQVAENARELSGTPALRAGPELLFTECVVEVRCIDAKVLK